MDQNHHGELDRKEKLKGIDLWMAHSSVDLLKDDLDLGTSPSSSKRIQARGFYRLAKVYYDKSDLNKAESFFLKGLAVSQDYEDDVFFVFKILGFLVRISSEKLESNKAEQYIKHSEKLVENISAQLPSLTAEYFYNEGAIKTYRGKFLEARESFFMSFRKAKEENEPEILAKSLYALSTGYFHSKEYESALQYLEQLAELLKILKKTYLYGTMHLLYGNIFGEVGDYIRALEHYQVANKALQDKTCWNLFSYILLGQGIIYKKKGEFNKALLYFELALKSIDEEVFKRLGNLLNSEIMDVNDSSVDLYLDRTNRIVYEKSFGAIDFKHRFVLLEILFLLAQKPGTYFDKEELAKSIWKDEYNPLIHDKLIYTSVSRLRKLIEPKNEKRKYIIRGKDGYTFNQHVKVRFHRESGLGSTPPIANIDLSSPV